MFILELEHYIATRRLEGASDAEIRKSLVDEDWEPSIVDSYLATGSIAPPHASDVHTEEGDTPRDVYNPKHSTFFGDIRSAHRMGDMRPAALLVIGGALSLPLVMLFVILFHNALREGGLGGGPIILGISVLILAVWMSIWSGYMQRGVFARPFAYLLVLASVYLALMAWYAMVCTAKMCEFGAMIESGFAVVCLMCLLVLRWIASGAHRWRTWVYHLVALVVSVPIVFISVWLVSEVVTEFLRY